ncbi:hypothetical protein L1887_51898 [Cichorium endivia]|nr:hypothetical protein L1887_51898 [Cichorium endivia]
MVKVRETKTAEAGRRPETRHWIGSAKEMQRSRVVRRYLKLALNRVRSHLHRCCQGELSMSMHEPPRPRSATAAVVVAQSRHARRTFFSALSERRLDCRVECRSQSHAV